MENLNFYENNEMDEKVTLYAAKFNIENGEIIDFTPIVTEETNKHFHFSSIYGNKVGFEIKINEDDKEIYLFKPRFEQLHFYNSPKDYMDFVVIYPSTNNNLSLSEFENKVTSSNIRVCIQTQIKKTFYCDFFYANYSFLMNTDDLTDKSYFLNGNRYEINELFENPNYQSFVYNLNEYLPLSKNDLFECIEKWEINLEDIIANTVVNLNSLKNEYFVESIRTSQKEKLSELVDEFK